MSRQWYAGLLASLLSTSLYAAAPVVKLTSYHCQVKKIDAHRAEVSTDLAASDAAGKPLVLIIARWDDERIENLVVTTGGRIDSAVKVEPLTAAIRLRMQAPSSAGTEISYSVVREPGELTRIPLPVPFAFPGLGQTPVEIKLTLPLGDVSYGELFPRMDWQSGSNAITTMGSVPSLLIVHSKPKGSISGIEQLSASRVADIAMVLLLLAGSLGWWVRYRFGRNAKVKGSI
jgi:hypothetical protein